MATHESGPIPPRSERLSPAPSVSAGFGFLRIDPASAEHQKALRAALRAGIKVFDLGSLSEEAALTEKTKWLLAEISTQLSNPPYSLLIRGKVGEANKLTDFLKHLNPVPSGIHWTYFIEGEHGTSYESFWSELSLLNEICGKHSEFSLSLGVSSARFTYEKEDPEFLSLEGLLASEESFSAIEFPLNLYESGPFEFANQAFEEETLSLLDAAIAYGLKTYTRRPFDALTDVQLLRLISYPDHHRFDLEGAVMETLKVALDAEKTLLESAHPKWAHRLHSQLQFVNDPEQWKEIMRRRIRPDLDAVRAEGKTPSRYLECMEALLLAVQLWCEKRAAERNERIRNRIATSSPAIRGASRNLAELALSVYRSMPGLTTVLIGMRSEDYVKSVLHAFNSDRPLLPTEAVSLALSEAHSAIHEALSETRNPS